MKITKEVFVTGKWLFSHWILITAAERKEISSAIAHPAFKARKYWDTNISSPHSQHRMQDTHYLPLIYSVAIVLTVNTSYCLVMGDFITFLPNIPVLTELIFLKCPQRKVPAWLREKVKKTNNPQYFGEQFKVQGLDFPTPLTPHIFLGPAPTDSNCSLQSSALL